MTKFHSLGLNDMIKRHNTPLRAMLLSGQWASFRPQLLMDALETLLQVSPGHCEIPSSITTDYAQRP
jgi:hypothetical protein